MKLNVYRFQKHAAFTAAIASVFSPKAYAQTSGKNTECPPGSWYCEPEPDKPSSPPPQSSETRPSLPPASDPGVGAATSPRPSPTSPPAGGAPPELPKPLTGPPQSQPSPNNGNPTSSLAPRPAPAPQPGGSSPPPAGRLVRPPSDLRYRRMLIRPEWGVNFRFNILPLARNLGQDGAMYGGGLSLRYKPAPYVGLEIGYDRVVGRDYYSMSRREDVVSVDGIWFINPRHITQFYVLGGLGWTFARADGYHPYYGDIYANYTYFGVFGGLGLEFRVSRYFAINVDARAFVRGRINRDDYVRYEFVNSEGKGSNVSGAAIFTTGATLYF